MMNNPSVKPAPRKPGRPRNGTKRKENFTFVSSSPNDDDEKPEPTVLSAEDRQKIALPASVYKFWPRNKIEMLLDKLIEGCKIPNGCTSMDLRRPDNVDIRHPNNLDHNNISEALSSGSKFLRDDDKDTHEWLRSIVLKTCLVAILLSTVVLGFFFQFDSASSTVTYIATAIGVPATFGSEGLVVLGTGSTSKKKERVVKSISLGTISVLCIAAIALGFQNASNSTPYGIATLSFIVLLLVLIAASEDFNSTRRNNFFVSNIIMLMVLDAFCVFPVVLLIVLMYKEQGNGNFKEVTATIQGVALSLVFIAFLWFMWKCVQQLAWFYGEYELDHRMDDELDYWVGLWQGKTTEPLLMYPELSGDDDQLANWRERCCFFATANFPRCLVFPSRWKYSSTLSHYSSLRLYSLAVAFALLLTSGEMVIVQLSAPDPAGLSHINGTISLNFDKASGLNSLVFGLVISLLFVLVDEGNKLVAAEKTGNLVIPLCNRIAAFNLVKGELGPSLEFDDLTWKLVQSRSDDLYDLTLFECFRKHSVLSLFAAICFERAHRRNLEESFSQPWAVFALIEYWHVHFRTIGVRDGDDNTSFYATTTEDQTVVLHIDNLIPKMLRLAPKEFWNLNCRFIRDMILHWLVSIQMEIDAERRAKQKYVQTKGVGDVALRRGAPISRADEEIQESGIAEPGGGNPDEDSMTREDAGLRTADNNLDIRGGTAVSKFQNKKVYTFDYGPNLDVLRGLVELADLVVCVMQQMGRESSNDNGGGGNGVEQRASSTSTGGIRLKFNGYYPMNNVLEEELMDDLL